MARKNRKEKTDSIDLKHKLTDMLELPKEVVLGLPLISMTGREELAIENYKGVIEYSEEKIRINTSAGVLKIEGKKLFLKQVTTENIVIIGNILKLEYLI